ncbi:hypothetical protein MGYG_07043 [Nannizzia gypsea CBS 118893]|uniref:Uncharacterized protein n=1 Tax=Arthroderma gypseum (strain ATCC MYA-4604 / CBS 118893) TaxID=535722 RepID=E4V1X2_ARTGP|nr:hypothetical protein MGYG_07043 [Nannizzia gypsea CBS 118893]EFR04037.1 hypothetical protein MGYG_07043 [Nannizzia gypsea CBS 118893]
MRFFKATLLMMAACVLADDKAKIGTLNTDPTCVTATTVGKLIDSICTSIKDIAAFNILADRSFCYVYDREDCLGEGRATGMLQPGCNVVADFAKGAPAVICYGHFNSQ